MQPAACFKAAQHRYIQHGATTQTCRLAVACDVVARALLHLHGFSRIYVITHLYV